MNRSNSKKTILVTGGSRSGKSTFAENLGESLDGPRAYIATCPPVDPEMEARIKRHRAEREGKGWDTIEKPIALAETLSKLGDYHVVLIDCLTLWINNILFEAGKRNEDLNEDRIVELLEDIKTEIADADYTAIFVTNEVGMGLVPPDPTSRLYRDLVGRCNQEIAKWADDVVLMTSGIPQYLKKGD